MAAGARVTEPLLRDGGELRPVAWERALAEAAAALARAGRRTGALVGGEATSEEGYLLARLMREGLESPHIDSRRAGKLALEVHRALNEPGLQARVSDLEFAHAVLVLAADPIEDAPILDLRLRKGARRHDVRLLRATAADLLDGARTAELAQELARGGRGDRDPVARTPHGGPRRRCVRAGAARAGGHPVARRHRRRGHAGNPLCRQRPRAARGGRAAERRSRPVGARDRRRHRTARLPRDRTGPRRRRARGALAAGVRPAEHGTAGRGRDAHERAARPCQRRSARRRAGRAGAVGACAGARLDGHRTGHVRDRRACASTRTSCSPPRPTPRRRARSSTPTVASSGCGPPSRGSPDAKPGALSGSRSPIWPPGSGSTWGCSRVRWPPQQLFDAVPFYAGLTLEEIGGKGVRWQDRPAAEAYPGREQLV